MTLGAKSAEVLRQWFRALARIQLHRRIERVDTHLVCWRDMKFDAGMALKKVNEGDGADVNELYLSKINFINLIPFN